MADNGSVIYNAKSAPNPNPIKKANSELDKLIADNKNINTDDGDDAPTTRSALDSAVVNISRDSGRGDSETLMQNLMWGVNVRGNLPQISNNTDHYGITLFTRPRLNLSYHNLLADRRLHPLATDDRNSLRRAIRAYLDPALHSGRARAYYGLTETIDTPLVDPLNPFIPMLSNTLLSLTGWPDVVGDTFTSEEGVHGETFSMFDGRIYDYSAFTLTGNFKNIPGDPITTMMQSWIAYGANVYSGTMVPYPDAILYNEIDYNTCIWRLVLDVTRTKVQKIARVGAAFPTSSPLGNAFNFNTDRTVSEENDQLSVQFQCNGVMYNDPLSVHMFNDLVGLFNPNMLPSIPGDHSSPVVGVVQGTYERIMHIDLVNRHNYHLYFKINPATTELELYLPLEQRDRF